MGKTVKMKVTYEKATTWITVKGSTWCRNGYPPEYVDRFGDVWLKPHFNAANLYTTIQEPALYFHIEDDCLIEM